MSQLISCRTVHKFSMTSTRDVSTLPLARSTVDLLLKNGFRFVSDLQSMQPLELSQELSVTPEVALGIIKAVESSFTNTPAAEASLQLTAKDILSKHGSTRSLITFCKQIDVMLGGGVPVGQITEFCGVPGVSLLLNYYEPVSYGHDNNQYAVF